jgi:hypothetical protein
MDARTIEQTLYVLNFALLFTHQIDSAYWKEWELFHIPGGPQLNLVLNFALMIVALAGLKLLVDGSAAGHAFSLLLAAAGVFAFGIHAFFLARGDARFRLPVCLAVLAATLPVSAAQAVVAIR